MKMSSRVVAILTFLGLAALSLFLFQSIESTQSTARATTSPRRSCAACRRRAGNGGA